MTRGLIIACAVRAEQLRWHLRRALDGGLADRHDVAAARWQAQRVIRGCEKALVGGAPRP